MDNKEIVLEIERLAGKWRPIRRRKTLGDLPPKLDLWNFLRAIPWITVERDGDKAKLVIDEELRAICEGRAPRPELNGWSFRAFMKNLRETIIQKRQAAHDGRTRSSWNPERVLKFKQADLLDWIERQLDTIP